MDPKHSIIKGLPYISETDQLGIYKPGHDKTCLCPMRTTKAQISLRIRAVWSVPLLFTA